MESILNLMNFFISKKTQTASQQQQQNNQKENSMTQPSINYQQAQEQYVEQRMLIGEKLFKIESKTTMKQSFHQFIGALTFTVKQNKTFSADYSGTGILISSNLILTAAHNIYSRGKGQHTNLKFYLAPSGDVEIKKYYEIQSWKYPQQYVSSAVNQKRKYDYAIIKLKDNIVNNKSFYQLFLTCPHCKIKDIQSMQLQIYGYPTEPNFKMKDKKCQTFEIYQYGLSKKNIFKGIILYGISTLGGHSGSPVINQQNILAIHNGNAKQSQEYNVGRLLTFDVIENVITWIKQLKGNQFTINRDSVCNHYKDNLCLAQLLRNQKKLHQVLNNQFENQVSEAQLGKISNSNEQQLILDSYKLSSLGKFSSLNSIVQMLFSATNFRKVIIALSKNPSLIFHNLIAKIFDDISTNQTLQIKRKSLRRIIDYIQNKDSSFINFKINDAISCFLQILNLLYDEDPKNNKFNYFKINYEPRCGCTKKENSFMLQCYFVKPSEFCIICQKNIQYYICI